MCFKEYKENNKMAKKIYTNRSIERKIYFYKIVCLMNGKEIGVDRIFDDYIAILNGNYKNLHDRHLAVSHFEKYHFLDGEKDAFDSNVYRGKFYSLRSTDFPYLFDMKSGDKKEISHNEQDALMEQTHFYCFTNKRLIVSEFNYFGARIERLGDYLSQVMTYWYPSNQYSIEITPIVIPEYFEQIVNCTAIAKLQFKVAHPGLRILAEEGIIGPFDVIHGELTETSDFCVDIELSGGGRGKNLPINNTESFLHRIVSAIKKGNKHDIKKSDSEGAAFRKAKIKAYNPSEFKLVPYDLLDEKLVHTCYVDKVSSRSKYVDSEKMYLAIKEAYISLQHDALKYMGEL